MSSIKITSFPYPSTAIENYVLPAKIGDDTVTGIASMPYTWSSSSYHDLIGTFTAPAVTHVDYQGLAMMNFSYINLPECISVCSYAFKDCDNLKSVNLPKCKTIRECAFMGDPVSYMYVPECEVIDDQAFCNCALSEINLPKCTTIGPEAFCNCNLLSINLPSCTSIGEGAFYGCAALSNVNMPLWSSVTSCEGVFYRTGISEFKQSWFNSALTVSNGMLGVVENEAFKLYAYPCKSKIKHVDLNISDMFAWAFAGCSIETIKLNSCYSLPDYAYRGCNYLSAATFNNCSIINSDCFMDCHILSSISIPRCEIIYDYAFYCCSKLNNLVLPMCSKISRYAFYYCKSLSSIVLGSSRVCVLTGTDAFYGTPLSSGVGSIYVPASLVTSYKQAANWSYFSSLITAME